VCAPENNQSTAQVLFHIYSRIHAIYVVSVGTTPALSASRNYG